VAASYGADDAGETQSLEAFRSDLSELISQNRKLSLKEILEQVAGARPGPGLHMNVRSDSLEASVRHIGHRLPIGFVVVGALIGAAVLTQADRVPRWIPSLAGVMGSALTVALLAD
jgi:hypothetical protein